MKTALVSMQPDDERRRLAAEVLGDLARVEFLADHDAAGRRRVLDEAAVLLSHDVVKELADDELARTGHLALIQCVTAGVDFIAFDRLPREVPVAVNAGAYAEPMAEHALAMILAAAKRLLVEHANLARGEFNQFTRNRMLAGMAAGILGFGGIGIATARILSAVGMRVHAINRRGRSDEPVDWIGTPGELDEMLAASDVLILSLPLTARSERMIGARELALMKDDAILVNLARGEIVDEDALYRHLRANPAFTACIDAWWVEPIRHGEFRMDRPFAELSNVIASPHNSASVSGWQTVAFGRALENCRRALAGEGARYVIGDEERGYGAGGGSARR